MNNDFQSERNSMYKFYINQKECEILFHRLDIDVSTEKRAGDE